MLSPTICPLISYCLVTLETEVDDASWQLFAYACQRNDTTCSLCIELAQFNRAKLETNWLSQQSLVVYVRTLPLTTNRMMYSVVPSPALLLEDLATCENQLLHRLCIKEGDGLPVVDT